MVFPSMRSLQEISLINSYQVEQRRKIVLEKSLLSESASIRNASASRYKRRFRQLTKRHANVIEYPIAS